MPADRTPAEWAAIVPTETDRALVSSYLEKFVEPGLDTAGSVLCGDDLLSAASRIDAEERAARMLAGYLSTQPGNTDKHPEEMLPEARRILGLEDR